MGEKLRVKQTLGRGILMGAGIIIGMIAVVVGGFLLLAVIFGGVHTTPVNVTAVNLAGYAVNTNYTSTFGSFRAFNSTTNATVPWSIILFTGSYNETVESFKINTQDFKIINISPTLPVKISSGKNETFTLNIRTPPYKFVGPLSMTAVYILQFPSPLAHINVTQVNFYNDNVSTGHAFFSSALNGFNASAGSYYLYSFQFTNGTITILSFATNTTGFKVLNVTPSLPLKLSNSRQLFTLRIAVPNYTYSGPVSIIERYK